MNTRDKLAAALGDHCWLSSDEQKINGEWTWGLNCECGEFVPDSEANTHLADALLASDVLRNMQAEAWDEGAEAAYFDPETRDQVNDPDNPHRADRVAQDKTTISDNELHHRINRLENGGA